MPAISAPHEQPEPESTRPAYTPEAARAIYDAISTIIASGRRAYSLNVPSNAAEILVKKGGGRISQPDALAQVKAAIVGLAADGKIEAYVEGYKDWLIKERLGVEFAEMTAPN